MQVRLYVCPVCGHAIDFRDNPSGMRGCFGNRTSAHARAERVAVTVEVDVTPEGLLRQALS